MATGRQCPHCGGDIGSAIHDCVASWISTLRARNLIAEDLASALVADVARHLELEPAPPTGRSGQIIRAFTPSMAFLLIGAILVVSSVVMLVTHFWEEMGGYDRLAVVGLPAIISYAVAEWTRRRHTGSPWVQALFATVGSCLAPFVVWLALRAPGSAEDLQQRDVAYLVSLATAGGLLLQLSAIVRFGFAILTLPASVTFVWMAGATSEYFWAHSRNGVAVAAALAVAGVLLMAWGQGFTRQGLTWHARAPQLVGALALLFGFTVLGAEVGSAADWWAIAVPLLLILSASRPQFAPHLWPAAVFLVINIFRIGLERFADSAGLPVTVLLCGLASMAVGYVVHRVRRELGLPRSDGQD